MPTADAVRPYFIPDGVDFDTLSPSLQAAIAAVINPAYKELVLAARSGLEKSIGLTIVHLAWLEILDQMELAQQLGPSGEVTPSEDRRKLIERHLRLVGAKSKVATFLLRLGEFQRKLAAETDPFAAAPRFAGPALQPDDAGEEV